MQQQEIKDLISVMSEAIILIESLIQLIKLISKTTKPKKKKR